MLLVLISAFTTVAQCQTPKKVKLVFITFSDVTDPVERKVPVWANDFAQAMEDYYAFVSNGAFPVDVSVLRRLDDPKLAWANPNPSTTYQTPQPDPNSPTVEPHYGTNNAWAIEEIYDHFASFQFPNPWEDTDYVIFMNYRSVFPYGRLMGIGGSGIGMVAGFDPQAFGWGQIGAPTTMLDPVYTIGATEQIHHMELAVAHELGHILGLAHVPNSACPFSPCSLPPCGTPGQPNWNNMGHYSVMDEWNPRPDAGWRSYHPEFLLALDWVAKNTVAPTSIPTTVTIPRLRDPSSGIMVEVIPPAGDVMGQRFLLVNHQGDQFDALYGGTGLLIWHLGPLGWDLESAAGKDPGNDLDPLEADYCAEGSGEDFFDPSPGNLSFSPTSNPNSDLYDSFAQELPSGLHVDNIRYGAGTDILADVWVEGGIYYPREGQRFADADAPGSSTPKTIPVRWAVSGTTVDVLFSDAAGGNFTAVAENLPNSGAYDLDVPAGTPPGTGYRVRVVPDDDPGQALESPDVTVWKVTSLSGGITQKDCSSREFDLGVSWTTSVASDACVLKVYDPNGTEHGTFTGPGTSFSEELTLPCITGTWSYFVQAAYSGGGVVQSSTHTFGLSRCCPGGGHPPDPHEESSPATTTAIPKTDFLAPGTPNPFTAGSRLRFGLAHEGSVRLKIFTIQGQLVRTLVDGTLSAGIHEYDWDGRTDAGERGPAGIYMIRLETQDGTQSGKLIRMR
jgi:hypothetical protein